MDLKGERLLPVDRETAWAALNDPERLAAAIPGCEAIEPADGGGYRVTVMAVLGPVRARFRGRLNVEDVVGHERYTLRFEGEGGAAGFAKGSAQVSLAEAEGGTRLAYVVAAQVGGRIAQIGSRLIDAAALKLADDFFAAFERGLMPQTEEPSPLEAIEASAVLHDPRTWTWVGWLTALVVVAILAVALLRR